MTSLTPTASVSRGDWVLQSLGAFGSFDGIIPPMFEAYARILHPASGQQLSWSGDQVSGTNRPMRWRDVAAREGTVLHPQAQWEALVHGHVQPRSGEDGWQYSEPELGRMDLDDLAAVAAVLARHTATPDACLAALWEGWGELHPGSGTRYVLLSSDDDELPPMDFPDIPRESIDDALSNPRFGLPGRESLLFTLDVRALTDSTWAVRAGWTDQFGFWAMTPLALWPEDRQWYLASEIDFDSTVIGGSRALIDELLNLNDTDAAEVFELPPSADLTSTGDHVNLH